MFNGPCSTDRVTCGVERMLRLLALPRMHLMEAQRTHPLYKCEGQDSISLGLEAQRMVVRSTNIQPSVSGCTLEHGMDLPAIR